MERQGITRFVGNEESWDQFGAKTYFRSLIEGLVDETVRSGKWFTFCKKIEDSQVDMVKAQNKKGIELGRYISQDYGNSVYRTAVYKYLLRDFLCYYEAPTVIHMRDSAGVKESYNKFLATSSLEVAAQWMGIDLEEADRQFGNYLYRTVLDEESDTFQYLKLYVDKAGNHKITKPRKELDLSVRGTRVVPVFALEAGVNVLFELASKDFYDVTFFKDGGAKRKINICFDFDKVREVYKGDESLLVDLWDTQYAGDFRSLKTMERGYIRVLEVGTNIRNNPMRSINYARIVGVEKSEPDLTFLHIDLDSVSETFRNTVAMGRVKVEDLVEGLDLFDVGKDRKYGGKRISNETELENWFNVNEMLLSTPFIKQVALFMIGNPQWFGGYTGQNSVSGLSGGESSVELGVALPSELDDDDLDLDF